MKSAQRAVPVMPAKVRKGTRPATWWAHYLLSKPRCGLRRIKWLEGLVTAPGKMIVPYMGSDGHVYVRFGGGWARVEVNRPRPASSSKSKKWRVRRDG